MNQYPQKWRPSLWMIVAAMLAVVLSLPLASLFIFRFYDSQLVRETENELIVQAALIRETLIFELEKTTLDASSLPLAPKTDTEQQSNFNLQVPQLDLTTAVILPPREEAIASLAKPSIELIRAANSISTILKNAQKTTLAGYRLIDHQGVVIGGTGEIGLSLADVLEVQSALKGKYKSAIRKRISTSPTPPIYAISRGTSIRVFIAMPIIYDDKILGAVYLSRTPSHFLRELYDQRWKVGIALIFILSIAAILAYIFIRTIKKPIDALNARTHRIRNGDKSALEPLQRHGTREIADLSAGLLNMSRQLHERAEYIQTFATHVSHELKSPLTSIQGAAELIRDEHNDLDETQRNHFLDNIIKDTDRLTQLVNRLRDHAAAENAELGGTCSLLCVINSLVSKHTKAAFIIGDNLDHTVQIPLENMQIVLSNLFDNSISHGADKIRVSCKVEETHLKLVISDNGEGISKANAERIFDAFFTTRRESGGTGMGLGIVKALLKTYDGDIVNVASVKGASFELRLPYQQ